MSEAYWITLQIDWLLENRWILPFESISVLKKDENADSKKYTLKAQYLLMPLVFYIWKFNMRYFRTNLIALSYQDAVLVIRMRPYVTFVYLRYRALRMTPKMKTCFVSKKWAPRWFYENSSKTLPLPYHSESQHRQHLKILFTLLINGRNGHEGQQWPHKQHSG